MRQLLLTKALESHTFAMRLYFLLQSSMNLDRILAEKIEDWVQDLEMIIINGRKPGKSQATPPDHLFILKGSELESAEVQFSRKQIRSDYFDNQV